MTEYLCPSNIAESFIDDDSSSKGRILVVEWLEKLELKTGDKVWLPEIGWCEKMDPWSAPRKI